MIARRVYLIAGLVLLTALALVLVAGCLLFNSSPVVSFTWGPSDTQAPVVVVFDASASHDLDGIIVRYEWDFGDGSGGSGESTTHTYTTSGTFTIGLRVTDNDGATASASETITILPPHVSPPDLPAPSPAPSPSPPSSGPLRLAGHGSPRFPSTVMLGDGATFYIEGTSVVSLFDVRHNWVALLADETGGFIVKNTVGVQAGIYYLDIAADGDWAITVFTVFTLTRTATLPQAYAGHGQPLSQYSSLFSVNSGGLTTFYMEGVERVVLLAYQGDWAKVLVSKDWGSFDGRATVDSLGLGGDYVLRVQASGDWSISVVESQPPSN